jgi:hypothetical protein
MKRINVVIAYKNGRTYTINNVHDAEAFFNKNGDLYISISYEANVDDLVYYSEEMNNIVSIMIFEG